MQSVQALCVLEIKNSKAVRRNRTVKSKKEHRSVFMYTWVFQPSYTNLRLKQYFHERLI